MPTLAETLNQNQQNTQLTRGAGGVLAQSQAPTAPGQTPPPPPSISQLSGQQGLATQPTTALGAALIGANPDQAKMAGGPAQLSAIANQQQAQQAPQQDLATSLRQQQTRTQATGQEQQTMQKSQDMQNLGGLGDRVTNFINAQRQKLVAANPVLDVLSRLCRLI